MPSHPADVHPEWVYLWLSLFLPKQLSSDSPICAASSVSCFSLLSSCNARFCICCAFHLSQMCALSWPEPGFIKAHEQMKFRRECYPVWGWWVLPYPSWVAPQEDKGRAFGAPDERGIFKWVWGPRHEKVVKWLTCQVLEVVLNHNVLFFLCTIFLHY